MSDYKFSEELVVGLAKEYVKEDIKEIDLQSLFEELERNLN